MTTLKTGTYKHYKNKQHYKVMHEATHSETREKVVVYQCLYGNYDMWVRPKTMVLETVELDGRQVPRFEFISDEE